MVGRTLRSILAFGVLCGASANIAGVTAPLITPAAPAGSDTPQIPWGRRLSEKAHAAPVVCAATESSKLVFDESAGKIFYADDLVADGVLSGRREGLNNPNKQHIRNAGAIPDGDYKIGYATNRFTKLMGRDALPLKPEANTRTFGRDGFYIHEIIKGVIRDPGTRGCIGLPNREAQEKLVSLVTAHHISELEVVDHAQCAVAQKQSSAQSVAPFGSTSLAR